VSRRKTAWLEESDLEELVALSRPEVTSPAKAPELLALLGRIAPHLNDQIAVAGSPELPGGTPLRLCTLAVPSPEGNEEELYAVVDDRGWLHVGYVARLDERREHRLRGFRPDLDEVVNLFASRRMRIGGEAMKRQQLDPEVKAL
jgi:hypothetical protein